MARQAFLISSRQDIRSSGISRWRCTMVELQLFSQELTSAQDRVAALQRRVEETGGRHELPLELLEELFISLEELQVAEEELRQQSDELVAARAAIEAEKQRYQELYQFAPDGYLVTDASGMIREANRVAGAMLDVAPEFLVGKPMANFLPAEE